MAATELTPQATQSPRPGNQARGLLAIASWALLSLLRKPAVWVWLGLLCAVWPALLSFSALGITTDEATPQAALYELCFIALLLGGFMGVSLLDTHKALFLRAARHRRLAAEALALTCACLPFLAAALAPALALSGRDHDLGIGELPARCVLAGIHLIAVSIVILHLPLGTSTRRAILPFALWLLPATVPPESALSPWIQRVFGIAQRLTSDGAMSAGTETEWGLWAAWLLPTLGWILLAWLTANAQPRDHAIRDPR